MRGDKMNLTERVELFNKNLSIHETLATEVKELPRYGRECCMDANADTTQTEFEKWPSTFVRTFCSCCIVYYENNPSSCLKYR